MDTTQFFLQKALDLSTSEIVTWVYLALQFLTLIIFLTFMLKYNKVFGEQKDPMTIICIVLVALNLTIKIVFKCVTNLHAYALGMTFSEYTATHKYNFWFDLNNLSNMLPQLFFHSALLINSVRWLFLVLLYKGMLPLNKKKEILLWSSVSFMIVILTIAILFQFFIYRDYPK